MDSSFERLRSLELTRDEVDKIGSALKKEEFRKMLLDYVQEIQDPENKKLYEKEIVQLEKERGNDVTFLHPEAGYVIKTSIDGTKKVFINICTNELVAKPSSIPSKKDGSRGLQWSLPHSLSPPSEDFDNKKERCQVFDVVYHPDTLHLANKNQAFRNMVNMTACKAIESHFDVKLDKNNLKFPKLKYKGYARPSIIRKPSIEGPIERNNEEKEFFDKLYAQMDEATPKFKSPKKNRKKPKDTENSIYTTPNFIIKHRRNIELEEFTENKESKLNVAIPKELVVEINLPLLKSANDIVLDVTEKTVQLTSEKPAKYKLNITLPYEVNRDNGNAKFDKDSKMLSITLPVRRKSEKFVITDYVREDSGVESDHGSPNSIGSEEENEKLPEVITNKSEFRTKFLSEDIEYIIPEFTCHYYDNVITYTLNVKNVDENSVEKLFDSNSIHVKFVSVSSSFYEVNYAFLVKLPSDIDNDKVIIETWDNNLTVQIPFNNCDNPSYKYGTSEDDLRDKLLEEPLITSINTENIDKAESNDENHEKVEPEETLPKVAQSESVNIPASYESSSEEFSCSLSPAKSRGILKKAPIRKFVSRSVSESSLDDFISCSLDHESMESVIPEDTEVSTSLKKTVRFNNVVSKQLYRFNSSILGQKKKNQRKNMKKKRALERRHSESEASELEDKKERENKTQKKVTKDNELEVKNDDLIDNEIFDIDI